MKVLKILLLQTLTFAFYQCGSSGSLERKNIKASNLVNRISQHDGTFSLNSVKSSLQDTSITNDKELTISNLEQISRNLNKLHRDNQCTKELKNIIIEEKVKACSIDANTLQVEKKLGGQRDVAKSNTLEEDEMKLLVSGYCRKMVEYMIPNDLKLLIHSLVFFPWLCEPMESTEIQEFIKSFKYISFNNLSTEIRIVGTIVEATETGPDLELVTITQKGKTIGGIKNLKSPVHVKLSLGGELLTIVAQKHFYLFSINPSSDTKIKYRHGVKPYNFLGSYDNCDHIANVCMKDRTILVTDEPNNNHIQLWDPLTKSPYPLLEIDLRECIKERLKNDLPEIHEKYDIIEQHAKLIDNDEIEIFFAVKHSQYPNSRKEKYIFTLQK